jgi:SAM-dependent methyltransferase
MSDRLLYHRFGWAYDSVVGEARGPRLEWLAGVLTESGARTVVDAGCGTGGHAVALARAGFDVVGLDRSAELIDAAVERALAAGEDGVRFEVGDLLFWAPDSPVDAVLCRGVLNDLLGDGDRQGALHAFARWLAPGGVVLLDVRDRDASVRRYDRGRAFEASARRGRDELTFTSTTIAGPEEGELIATERWHGLASGRPVDLKDTFRMRSWTPAELESRALAAGFQSVEFLDGEAAGARSDRLVALLRKGDG